MIPYKPKKSYSTKYKYTHRERQRDRQREKYKVQIRRHVAGKKILFEKERKKQNNKRFVIQEKDSVYSQGRYRLSFFRHSLLLPKKSGGIYKRGQTLANKEKHPQEK